MFSITVSHQTQLNTLHYFRNRELLQLRSNPRMPNYSMNLSKEILIQEFVSNTIECLESVSVKICNERNRKRGR